MLTDDLAFIAASQPQVDSVSAVAMEQDYDRHSVSFKLAANEGVTFIVKDHFDQLFAVLRNHARKGIFSSQPEIPLHATYSLCVEIGRRSCMDQLFDIIVNLNFNKILGRLGSKMFQRPAYMTKIREPLTTRLRHMIHTLHQTPSTIPARQDLALLENQIHDFETSFGRLEEAGAENAIYHTKIAIQKAYQMTGNGIGFPGRLKGLGYSVGRLDDRDIREVGTTLAAVR